MAKSPRRRSAGSGVPCFDRDFLVGGGLCSFFEVYKSTGERELGRGAFGWVERCYHKPSGQVRAVKRIAKAGVTDLLAVEHEVNVLRALDHPNIVRLYDVFEDKRYLYLCMELCEGGDLEERIARVGHVSERTASMVIKQLMRAVYYMHATHSLAHRDVKPANCMLAGGPNMALEQCDVKLIDFGISCHCGPGEALEGILGTAAYAAPEVWSGGCDLRSDIWSLGLVLHELLCGRLPKTCEVDFSAPAWHEISSDPKELVQGMLQKDPSKRWHLLRCLEHPWVQLSAPGVVDGRPLHPEVVLNMRRYAGSSVLRKAALQAVVTRLNDQQIRELWSDFVRLDTNHDGVLSMRELRVAIAGSRASADLQRLFDELDTDGDGELQYTEFLAAAVGAKRYLQHEVAWVAFQQFDRDGDGQITTEELQDALACTHDPHGALGICADTADIIISAADLDGDGTVSFEEFIQVLQLGERTHADFNTTRKRPAVGAGLLKKRRAVHQLTAGAKGSSPSLSQAQANEQRVVAPAVRKRPACHLR